MGRTGIFAAQPVVQSLLGYHDVLRRKGRVRVKLAKRCVRQGQVDSNSLTKTSGIAARVRKPPDRHYVLNNLELGIAGDDFAFLCKLWEGESVVLLTPCCSRALRERIDNLQALVYHQSVLHVL